MMGKVNDIVGLGAVVVVPVKGEVVAGLNLDGVGVRVIAEDVAPYVD